jgi:hypothetical protein
MKREVGLWVDHRRAVIVIVADEGEQIEVLRSHVDKRERPSGGSHGSRSKTLYGPQDVLAEDKGQRRFAHHLSRYYDRVISCIRDAESIFIFGPGEAKVELRKRLENEELGGRIVAMETVDKMTDRQIAAKVRLRFRQ